jgi:competence protein ComEC
VLVDAGPRSDSRDAGRDVVVPFLTRHGVRRLDLLVVSHSHLDHQGGAAAVLDRIGAAVVLEPGRAAVDGAYRAFLDAVDRTGARWSVARSGQRFAIDGVAFEILHPDTTWAGWGTDLNEDSIVLRVRAGRFEAVLGGDAGLPVESLLRGRVGGAEVLKVGHHGSRTASGSPWLDEIHPRVAVVSVGTNRDGHPAPAALARLDSAGADVWRTDREGTITVVVESTRMQVRGRNRAVWYPLE